MTRRYPWQHRHAVRARAQGRYELDCGHVVTWSVAKGGDCPACFAAWWERNNPSPQLLRLPTWARLHAMAYPSPPERGTPRPVQVVLPMEEVSPMEAA